jgi:hypothetical protein
MNCQIKVLPLGQSGFRFDLNSVYNQEIELINKLTNPTFSLKSNTEII